MILRPPRSTLFPYRRSSDLCDPPLSEKSVNTLETHGTGLDSINRRRVFAFLLGIPPALLGLDGADQAMRRSEEHTSELQSRQYLVCRLLLEKKKKISSQ